MQPAPPLPASTLHAPVGALMRPASSVAPEDSLRRAVQELRRSGNSLVAVTLDGKLVGVVTEQRVATALGESIDENTAVAELMEAAEHVATYCTGAEALRQMDATAATTLVVVDDEYTLMGLLSPSDLFPRPIVRPRPSPVGGMATPFGVYLTNGAISGGVGDLALVATGAMLFLMLTAANWALVPVAYWAIDNGAPDWLTPYLLSVAPVVLFMALMRLIPLSGTHAAEHMVVHAIERGEDLSSDLIRRMPRVHPRCGTNLAVGAMLFMGIFFSDLIPYPEIRFVAAALVTFLFWRRLGSLVQYYVTTKPPKPRQVESGIKAANELLDRYASSKVAVPSVPVRIWRSGMLQVMLGSFLCFSVVYAIALLADYFWNVKLPI